MNSLKVLFLIEGYSDIRFVTGLSEVVDLTLAVPRAAFHESGLKERIEASGAQLQVHEIPGGRLAYQVRSLLWLLRHAREFDVILCQEFLRGALNGTLVGALTRVPAVTYMNLPPVEYFRCRRERGQIGFLKAWVGELTIRFLMTCNGILATKCLALGPYLCQVASRYSSRVEMVLYYGIDTKLYCPVDELERMELRRKCQLPADKFVVFFSSRVSHEKDPETVLRAVALAREKGLDAVVVNLGGTYQDFLKLAEQMGFQGADQWVLGRPAAHPMQELQRYYQAADCLAQASLEEGLGMSPLEALACGIPAICTEVGGLGQHLNGYARMIPRRDAEAMCEQFLWVARHGEEARSQALRGREYVVRSWNRSKAFSELASILQGVAHKDKKMAEETA
jgi:glycosyltransferase involved in cell wall biosynthesis